MFKIEDGREHFYQWDIDRRVIVEDSSVTEVHFCNRTGDCSLVSEVYDFNGIYVANVPNILLQTDWKIHVYAYDGKHTKHDACFEVKSRTKPESYAYTETEIKTWEQLEQRVEDVEANVGTVVEDYMKEHPVEVDLTGYATEKYVDDAVSAIDIPEVDLTGYATEQYVDDAISAIDIPTPEASVEEIYIGTTAPTDENIKVWINPNETTDFATMEEVEAAIDAIPSGDSGGNVYTFEFNMTSPSSTITDNDKTVFEEIHSNKQVDYALYVTDGTWVHKINNLILSTGYLNIYPDKAYQGVVDYYQVTFDSNGKFKNISGTWANSSGAKDWIWEGQNGDCVSAYENSHIKIVGYIDGDSSYIVSYDISTSNGNNFSEEYGTRYYVWDYSQGAKAYFYNTGGNIEFKDEGGNNLFTNGNFTLLGIYKWG